LPLACTELENFSSNIMFDTATERVYITKQGETKNATLVTSQEAISTQKHKCKVLLRIASEIDFPAVRTFLESVARNSSNSKASYETGLKHFQRFLVGSTNTSNNCHNYNVETIIPAIQAGGSINVYELMDGLVSYFVVQLSHKQYIAPTSIFLYVHAVKSYLLYHDIDINSAKFRRKVRLPKIAREDEQPIDASDIRKLLLACSNRRLKAYLLLLASGGMRANEGLAIRYRDIDFSVSPTRVHIRKEFTKTKVARDIYISDEATMFLKIRQFLS
jgi:site-specific recombinase XerD